MALFRRFFYKKPPDGLLLITDNIYVFDHCFSMNLSEEDHFEVHIRGIARHLQEHFRDASFMVSNFGSREKDSHISHILSEYDVTVLEYPGNYEGCPLLTMEMIHCFLKSSESWLSLGQHNYLLMHCEQGGWPVLSFMLAALLIYLKHYTNEQKTLDMLYKQAPSELLEMFSPLNPMASQLRYLHYISMRNVMLQWPPGDRALTLDCVILRMVPNFHGQGGFRPIFRIYGPDPLMPTDQTPKVLFSTPKNSKLIRFYTQADELVKINLQCHIQGDVVLECISLVDDLDREEMVFRIMFNTAFIGSNILMLNRDQIDILWDMKERFPKDFRAEVIFSEMDATTSLVTTEPVSSQEKQGLGVEEFAKVRDIFNHLDWADAKEDATLRALEQIALNTSPGDVSASSQQESEVFFDSREELEIDNISSEICRDELERDSLPSTRDNVPPISLRSKASTISFVPKTIPSSPPSRTISPLPISAASNLKMPRTSIDSSVPVPCAAAAAAAASLSTLSLDTMISQPPPPPSLPPIPLPPTTSKSRVPQLASMPSLSAAHHMQDLRPVEVIPPPPTLSGTSVSSIAQKYATQTHVGQKPLSTMLDKSPLNTHSQSLDLPLPPPSPSPPPPPPPPPSTATMSIAAEALPCPTSSLEHSPTLVSEQQKPSTNMLSKLSSDICKPPVSPISSVPSVSMKKDATVIRTLTPSASAAPPLVPASHFRPSMTPLTKFDMSASHPSPPSSTSSLALPSSSSVEKVTNMTTAIAPPPPPPPPPLFSNSRPPPPLQSSFLVSSPSTRSAAPRPPPPPPPPPLHSSSSRVVLVPPPRPPPSHSSSSRVISVPSAPPAPPLPPFGSKKLGESVTQKSTPGPPPPPAAHLPKDSSKTGRSCPVPPPSAPASSFGVKARSTAQSRGPRSLRPSHSSKRASLKPLHWVKVTRATQGSLWAEAQKSDEASKTPEIDISELESLFSVAMPNPDAKGSRQHSSIAMKRDKVHLIELQRAKNCEIMLRNIKTPLPDLMNSVLALDDSIVDADKLDNLIKFCPTKEEMELLKGYTGDKENLGKCEQFFLELMKVPRVESKLRVLSFKIKFLTQVADLKSNLNIINYVAEEVRNSVKLKRIMQTILSLGNALNQGTARGSAVGFKLDSLLKLIDIRARNSKMTLMHYLCKVLADKLPEVLDFDKDLIHLEPASKIQLKDLAEEMQAITKGLEKVEQELTTSESDGPGSEIFYKKLKEFLDDAQAEGRSLALLYGTAGKSADSLAHYFGEDPVRCPFEQVISTLLNFVKTFERAHAENLKQIELEKKRAQMEAEREKAKLTAHKKEDSLAAGIGRLRHSYS